MVQAQVGDLVKVHYTGRLADGTTFDSSMAREPLEFTLGDGELIPGFEQAVIGMTAGESKTTTILADQAYGPHHAERVIDVERHHLPSDLQPELGQRLLHGRLVQIRCALRSWLRSRQRRTSRRQERHDAGIEGRLLRCKPHGEQQGRRDRVPVINS